MITVSAATTGAQTRDSTSSSTLRKTLIAGSITTLCAASFSADRKINNHFDRPEYREHFWARSGTYTRSFSQLGIPVITFAAGKIFRNPKLSRTSVQAFTAGSVVFGKTFIIKMLSGRKRPEDSNNPADFTGPGMLKHTSFISGRTSVAFALATVFSKRHNNNFLIPAVSYTAAAAVSFSGIMSNEHWISDLAFGAAIGCATGYWVNKVFESHRFNLYPAFTATGSAGAGLTYTF